VQSCVPLDVPNFRCLFSDPSIPGSSFVPSHPPLTRFLGLVRRMPFVGRGTKKITLWTDRLIRVLFFRWRFVLASLSEVLCSGDGCWGRFRAFRRVARPQCKEGPETVFCFFLWPFVRWHRSAWGVFLFLLSGCWLFMHVDPGVPSGRERYLVRTLVAVFGPRLGDV